MPRFATERSDGELQDNSLRGSLLHYRFANYQQPITFACPLSAEYITVSLLVTFGCQLVLKLTSFYFAQALVEQLGLQSILGTGSS